MFFSSATKFGGFGRIDLKDPSGVCAGARPLEVDGVGDVDGGVVELDLSLVPVEPREVEGVEGVADGLFEFVGAEVEEDEDEEEDFLADLDLWEELDDLVFAILSK